MNNEELLAAAPTGLLWLTITDPAGNELVSGVPLERLRAGEVEGELPGLVLTWADGSDRQSYWEVSAVENADGGVTRLVGPSGVAILSPRVVTAVPDGE